MTTVITTFSKDGYELYGHKMLETWIEHWSEEYNLLVYTENFNILEKDSRIKVVDLNHSCPDLLEFKEKSNALLLDKNRREISRIQKTVKWSHKVFAITDAILNSNDDYFIFLDGDTYTTNPVGSLLAEKLIEDHLIAVHFEYLKGKLHFETGLIVFNKKHKQIEKFLKLYKSAYVNMTIYNEEKTWDGFWLAQLYKELNLDIKNLSEGESKVVFGHHLVRNILKHDVGTEKYLKAGYNKFTGKKND